MEDRVDRWESNMFATLMLAMGLLLGGCFVGLVKEATLDKTDMCENCEMRQRIEELSKELDTLTREHITGEVLSEESIEESLIRLEVGDE